MKPSLLSASALVVLSVVAAAVLPGAAANAVSAPAPAGLPDLVADDVYSIVHVPDDDATARAFVYIAVGNDGSVAALASQLAWTLRDAVAQTAATFDQQAGLVATGSLTVPALAPGDGVVLRLDVSDYVNGDASASFTRSVLSTLLDAADHVAELDEDNNARSDDVFTGEVSAGFEHSQ